LYIADRWRDYEVLDTGGGEKLERWADIVLRRPDPQVIWPASAPDMWGLADASYERSASGGGQWFFARALPEKWVLRYGELRFYVRPTGFKHTGLFPEQAVNWDWMAGLIRGRMASGVSPVRVLNLFGYTGGATMACAAAGAAVTHVDAAKGMITWAGDNRQLCALPETSGRWIVEDCVKFAAREARRGRTYDAVLLDPPSYGRGPGGEVWKLEDQLFALADVCGRLLSERPLFMLINSYTTGLQPAVLSNILRLTAGNGRSGEVKAREVGLPVTSGGVLPCGASGRWWAND